MKCAIQLPCVEIYADYTTYVGVMIAHCFRQIKECACGVEKNRSDHFNGNVRRASCLRNITSGQPSTLTPNPGAGAVRFSSFANERLRYSHFVSHLFLLAGTSCHFAAVFICAI